MLRFTLAKECIIEMLDKFAKAGKVLFENGTIWVVNMRRHHPSNSPKVTARINADMVLVPDCDLKRKCMQSLNMIPIPYPYPTDTESLKDKIRKDEDNIFSLYEKSIGAVPSTLVDELLLYEKEFPYEWIVEAFKITVENNKRAWSYTRAILKRWKTDGFQKDNRSNYKDDGYTE